MGVLDAVRGVVGNLSNLRFRVVHDPAIVNVNNIITIGGHHVDGKSFCRRNKVRHGHVSVSGHVGGVRQRQQGTSSNELGVTRRSQLLVNVNDVTANGDVKVVSMRTNGVEKEASGHPGALLVLPGDTGGLLRRIAKNVRTFDLKHMLKKGIGRNRRAILKGDAAKVATNQGVRTVLNHSKKIGGNRPSSSKLRVLGEGKSGDAAQAQQSTNKRVHG
mmetsp:Transcript_428/g.1300  ORF Transcript_428/g.1300 Transcript_428/m.1300 type:complete len:217 (+) Transcript_428:734-1384(+)